MILYASLGLYTLGYAMTFRRILWIITTNFAGFYCKTCSGNHIGAHWSSSWCPSKGHVKGYRTPQGAHCFWAAVLSTLLATLWVLIAPVYIVIKNHESFCHLNKLALPPKDERAKLKLERDNELARQREIKLQEREQRIAQLEREVLNG